MLRHLTGLLLLSAITFGAGLGRPAITESDEAFYAEAAREMIERSDWLTPHFNYEYRLQKPILYYWLAAIGYGVAGVSEAAARLPSALAGLGLVIVTYFAARRRYDAGTGLLAGSIVATNYGYVAIGRQALPDLLLTAFVMLATWCLIEWAALRVRAAAGEPGRVRAVASDPGRTARAHPVAADRAWLMAGAAATAAAFLTKGPVGVILPMLVVLPVVVVQVRRQGLRARAVGSVLRVTDLTLALIVFLALVSPWYVAMVREHGVWYLGHFFIGENVERFATDRYNDPRPIWFYLPVIAGGLLPWSPCLLLLAAPVGRVLMRRRRLSTVETGLVIWAVVPVLFYTASIGKQPRYVLPVLPPLAILLARAISARLQPRATAARGYDALLNACVFLASALLLLVPAGLLRMTPLLHASGYPGANALSIGLLIGAGLLPLLFVGARVRRWIPLALVGGAAVALVTVQYAVYASTRRPPVEQMAAAVVAQRTAQEPVATYRAFERNLIFYSHVAQVPLFEDQSVVDFLHSPRRVLCVIDRRDLDRLSRQHGLTLRELFEVSYFDPARIRLETVLRPDLSRDLETAVLVSNR